MATFSSNLRRGLPRVAGGDAWPPAGVAAGAVDADVEAAAASGVAESVASVAASAAPAAPAGAGVAGAAASGAEVSSASAAPQAPTAVAAPLAAPVALRRGLPRTPGGEPWPPASVTTVASAAAAPPASVPSSKAHSGARGTFLPTLHENAQRVQETAARADSARTQTAAAAATATEGEALRRGLPRTAGGDPWPPAGSARVAVTMDAEASAPAAADFSAAVPSGVAASAAETPAGATDVAATASPTAAAPPSTTAETPATAVAAADGPRAPLAFTQTVWPGRAASHRPAATPEPKRYGPFTKGQWAGAVIVCGFGLLIAAGMAVAFVRFFLSLDFMQDFLATYPGEYHLPEGAPVGIPAWLGWQHFFNVFLMVLIIRSGLTIRHEKRPAVFWAPKNNPKGKTSLTIWFHQGLDIFWIVNGLVFVVLLFVTGQWMRIVPTSWEVFPNALSAALQYVSLDWPTENGWVNYNSLQQLAYFSTVFLAAPLAVASGFRMSGLWPKKNAKLSAAIPIDWARKVHFPTMLFFVVFIVIHVALVFATGALRNLNHMYAAQGSVDGVAYADNWTGFWMFVLSLVVIAVAWVAARPMTIAPIARLFGTVSGR